jgi:hypothetical protein
VTREEAERRGYHGTDGTDGTDGRDGTEQEWTTNRINSHEFRNGESCGKGAAEKERGRAIWLLCLSFAISQRDSEITDGVTVGAMAEIVEKRGVDVQADKTDGSVCQREMDSSHVR